MPCHGYDGVEPFCGLAVAAEYDFRESVRLIFADCGEDFRGAGFVFEPKRSGAVYAIGVVAQAEGAAAWAAVGYVEVKSVLDLICDGHAESIAFCATCAQCRTYDKIYKNLPKIRTVNKVVAYHTSGVFLWVSLCFCRLNNQKGKLK